MWGSGAAAGLARLAARRTSLDLLTSAVVGSASPAAASILFRHRGTRAWSTLASLRQGTQQSAQSGAGGAAGGAVGLGLAVAAGGLGTESKSSAQPAAQHDTAPTTCPFAGKDTDGAEAYVTGVGGPDQPHRADAAGAGPSSAVLPSEMDVTRDHWVYERVHAGEPLAPSTTGRMFECACQPDLKVVLFGEEHDDVVAHRIELELCEGTPCQCHQSLALSPPPPPPPPPPIFPHWCESLPHVDPTLWCESTAGTFFTFFTFSTHPGGHPEQTRR